MKKLLFVILSLGCGGAERSLINLFNELSPEEYSLDLLLFRKEGAFLRHLPAHVRLLDTPKDLARLYGPFGRAGRLAPVKLLGTLVSRIADGRTTRGRMMFRWKRFYSKVISPLPDRYDVAVAYLEGEATYYVCDFVNAGKKLVWVHNDYSKLGQRAEDDLPYFEKADAIVTVSAGCEAVLKRTFPTLESKICMLENITSADAVRHLADAPAPAEYHADRFTIVSGGRLTKAKGFDMAIDAAALLKKRGVPFEWFILGQGALRNALQKQINACGVADAVHLLGVRANPYPYIKHAQLLVQSSRFEGKSIVVDEAKILCTPVLLTEYSTARDQITDGQNGWIAAMNAEALAENISRLMAAPEQLQAVRRAQAAEGRGNTAEVEKYKKLFNA